MVDAQLVLPGAEMIGGQAMADPTRDIRTGAIIAVAFFVLFLGWAAFVRLDAAAYAPGTLVVSGERQSVQHRDGGVVHRIMVREGQQVRQGQLLVSLAAADVIAQERALSAQAIRLLAQRARLEAEQLGLTHVVAPVEYAQLRPDDRDEARSALRMQQTELDARLATLAAQRQTLGQRAAQSSEQGHGYSAQVVSAQKQRELVEAQLAALRPVAEKGFVSQTRMRELERQRAELIGQQEQYAANVAQTREARRESQFQMVEAEHTFRERTASDLREVETTLSDVLPRLAAARDQLVRTEIRAPVAGAIVGLSVFTPGGVIQPGQKLMDIVPEKAPLMIQVRISPDDADDLKVGQTTRVKFPSFHDGSIPDLEGQLTRLSADAFTDEKTGQSFFTGQVTVSDRELARLKGKVRKAYELRAGMPAEVLVPLRRRTALEYALEPLLGAFWSSFREH